MRPFGAGDVDGLCALVDADRLPGQPPCTSERVAAVLAGRATADAWWWGRLSTMRVMAADSDAGVLVGAGAIGRSGETGDRYLLWLHAGEDRRVVDALLVHLLRGARRADPVYAFWFGTELCVGVEGLPAGARPVTHAALLARGFTGEERWLYLWAADAGPAPEVPGSVTFRRRGVAGDLRVEVMVDGRPVGGIELGLPAPGVGVLWWLEIEPEHRHRGLGRQLLRAARQVLAEHGAPRAILFVDRDDTAGGDWRPALRLYLSEGFTVVDHLWSYRRGAATTNEAGPTAGM